MAVIGKLRERGKLLVIGVGGALALFVVGELLNSPKGAGDEAVGSIAGDDVGMREFANRVEAQLEIYRKNGNQVDDQLQQQVRDGVWNDIVHEHTLLVQAEHAGFGSTISKDEYDDIRFGNNVMPDFRNPRFQGPDGQPDKERLREFFKQLQQSRPDIYELQRQTFVPQRIYAKYNTLVKKSCFVNTAQVKQDWAAKNTKATFNFVAKRFDAEPDSLYAVNDEDLRRYYDAHKSERRWKQTAARSFVYVQFPAVPLEEDIENTRKELEQLKTEFAASKDMKADSAFVVAYSDTKNAKPVPYTPGTADKLNDSLIVNADTGSVVGPFREGNTFKLVKVAELADVAEARVRHILLKSDPSNDAQKKQQADSILAVLKKDRTKFDALVTQFSDDGGSKNTGGVYEWFDKQRMVPEFTKASFEEKVGAITVCKTSYGYHIVEVLGQRTRKERRVFTVDSRIEPVQAMKEAWRKANEFSLKNLDSAGFRKSAEEQGLTYTPVQDQMAGAQQVAGLQDSKSVLQWVNHASPDDMLKPSAPLPSGDSYVVGMLTGIREEGAPELNDVRVAFTNEVRKEKKAEALAAKMNGKTDLNALATELGTAVQPASDVPLSTNSLPGNYYDAPVIGQVFSLQNGQTSVPLKGDMGVYVVSMTTLTPAPAEMPKDAQDAKTMADRIRNQADGYCFSALKEAAKVVDQRSRFY